MSSATLTVVAPNKKGMKKKITEIIAIYWLLDYTQWKYWLFWDFIDIVYAFRIYLKKRRRFCSHLWIAHQKKTACWLQTVYSVVGESAFTCVWKMYTNMTSTENDREKQRNKLNKWRLYNFICSRPRHHTNIHQNEYEWKRGKPSTEATPTFMTSE